MEGLFSLMLCNVGDFISGFYLHYFKPLLERVPILLALLPTASDARGDVYSSYGSRLGTLLHLGLYRRYIKVELASLIFLIISVNLWVGFLTYVIDVVVGKSFGELTSFAFIAFVSAVLSALAMVPATTFLALASFKRGLDPDNIVAPVATLFGDIVTIPTIVCSYVISQNVAWKHEVLVIAFALLAAGMLSVIAWRLRCRESAWGRYFKIIRENLGVIAASTCFSAVAGAILFANASTFLTHPGIIAIVPAFLEDGGAIACRFSARLSTMLHLGRVKPSAVPRDPWIGAQFLINYVHAAMIFTSLSSFGSAVALAGGGGLSDVVTVFLTVEAAGFLLTTVVSVLTYYLAIVSFKKGLDPDNVLAPLLTSMADAIGTASLNFVLSLVAHYFG